MRKEEEACHATHIKATLLGNSPPPAPQPKRVLTEDVVHTTRIWTVISANIYTIANIFLDTELIIEPEKIIHLNFRNYSNAQQPQLELRFELLSPCLIQRCIQVNLDHVT